MRPLPIRNSGDYLAAPPIPGTPTKASINLPVRAAQEYHGSCRPFPGTAARIAVLRPRSPQASAWQTRRHRRWYRPASRSSPRRLCPRHRWYFATVVQGQKGQSSKGRKDSHRGVSYPGRKGGKDSHRTTERCRKDGPERTVIEGSVLRAEWTNTVAVTRSLDKGSDRWTVPGLPSVPPVSLQSVHADVRPPGMPEVGSSAGPIRYRARGTADPRDAASIAGDRRCRGRRRRGAGPAGVRGRARARQTPAIQASARADRGTASRPIHQGPQ